jgi:hypothetical protein
MSRVFPIGKRTSMRQFAIALGMTLAVAVPATAWAQTPPPTCSVIGTNIITQNESDVTISCSGMPEAMAGPLAVMLTRVLQERLDPQQVLAKLNEVAALPVAGSARTVSDDQRQAIVRSLSGKPAAEVAMIAHPLVEDSAELAQELAMPLVMVGWQLQGNQIRRLAPKHLDPIPGIALVVRDANKPPPKAEQLKAALIAGRLGPTMVSDPAMAPDGVLLWIGRRPGAPPEPPK